MKKNLISLLFIATATLQSDSVKTTSVFVSDSVKITSVFVDVTALLEVNSWRASGYVGKIAAMQYAATVGHTPTQADLFKQLKPLKAKSTQITYNENLEMPLIFSDWLATIETNTKLKDSIQKYLNNKNISDIEKKVLFAIVSMMLT
ncbi:hypothetical protein KAZ82_01920, partial [Candidatus Babeliales bacterium]|nr:hypothetical protein [Candidatus Babeliales bacterium]